MSKYTTEVRFICENYAGLDESVGYNDVEEVLDNSWEQIFDFNFPIFDEEYRAVLCKKILKHYYTREIGFETVGLWKLKLNMAMNEIMPYYNKLYESELLRWNPLEDADYTKTHEGTDEGSGTDRDTGTVNDSNSHGGTVGDAGSHTGTIGDSGSHTGTVGDLGTHTGTVGDVGSVDLEESTLDAYSDTPQGALTNVENNTYLTNARKVSHESDTDTTNTRTYNESNGNTRTFNEANGNTRTFNESTSNTRTYNETVTNQKTNNLTRTREYSNEDEYFERIKGKMPGRTFASMVKEFRETFLNIDIDVIADLGDLFIKLW